MDGVAETSNLSGCSLEGASGVVLRDLGWYFESAGIMPPFVLPMGLQNGGKERKENKIKRNMEAGES